MAEHADSFHVRCDRIEHAVEWLEQSRALGLVLPQRGAWFTVLVAPHHVGSVLAANHYVLVSYEYLDGERVTARLFEGPRELAHLERSFEGKQASRFEAKPWIKQRVIDRAQARTLERGLAAPWPTGLERHWVAEVLGLHPIAWTSGEELMTRRADLVARFPGSVLVEAGDPVLDAEKRIPRATPPAATRTVDRHTPTPVPSIILDTTSAPTSAAVDQRTPAPTARGAATSSPSSPPAQPPAGGAPTAPGQPARVAGEPTHVAGQPTHVAGQPAHVAGQQAHVAGEPAHVAGQSDHVAGQQAHAGQPTHVAGQPAHVAGQPAHVAGQSSTLVAPGLLAPDQPSPVARSPVQAPVSSHSPGGAATVDTPGSSRPGAGTPVPSHSPSAAMQRPGSPAQPLPVASSPRSSAQSDAPAPHAVVSPATARSASRPAVSPPTPPLEILDELEAELRPPAPQIPYPVDPSRPAIIPNLPLTDEWTPAPEIVRPGEPNRPVEPGRAGDSGRPAAIHDLPLTDEFASDTPPPPRSPALTTRRNVILCSLSKQRQELLKKGPALVETLLENRFDEEIPGLLDLGVRTEDLVEVLRAANEHLVEALRPTTSRPIAGTTARFLDPRAVVRIAGLLREIDLRAITAVPGQPRIAEDLRALIQLYTETAQKGHAMLIAHD